jgi:hypothetical protein
VLEQKRAEGSATTFVAGRLDAPQEGLQDGRIVLLWTGDSRLRLWNGDGELTGGLDDTFVAGAGWSTRLGLVGDGPHVLVARLGDPLTHLSVYSDGLASLTEWNRPLLDAELLEVIDDAQHSPASDDIAAIDVWLRPAGQPSRRRSTAGAARTPAQPATTAEPPAPGSARMDAREPDAEPFEDEDPTLKLRRPRQSDWEADRQLLDGEHDVPARLSSDQPGQRAARPAALGQLRTRGPSLRLAVVVLVLGILFGLLVGLGGAWLFAPSTP